MSAVASAENASEEESGQCDDLSEVDPHVASSSSSEDDKREEEGEEEAAANKLLVLSDATAYGDYHNKQHECEAGEFEDDEEEDDEEEDDDAVDKPDMGEKGEAIEVGEAECQILFEYLHSKEKLMATILDNAKASMTAALSVDNQQHTSKPWKKQRRDDGDNSTSVTTPQKNDAMQIRWNYILYYLQGQHRLLQETAEALESVLM